MNETNETPRRATLHVCTTCRAGRTEPPWPGRLLHDTLAVMPLPAGLRLAGVECFANCDRACSAAIMAPGKWSYLLGNLTPRHAADLLVYASAYLASATGTVLPSRRPASLRSMVIGRMPPAGGLAPRPAAEAGA
jgi:predicted metal-binding protein